MRRLRRALDLLCGTLAAAALFGIMLLTLVDVTGRKLLAQSVPGSLEFTELLMVVVIFAGLPLVSLHGEHVVFDSLDRWLPPSVRRVQGLLVDAACAAALLATAWLLWLKSRQFAEFGDTTAQLGIPLSPFIVLMGALALATALVHGLLLIAPVAHHHPGVEDAAL